MYIYIYVHKEHILVGWPRLGVFHAILNRARNAHFSQQENPTSQQELRFAGFSGAFAGLSVVFAGLSLIVAGSRALKECTARG